MCEPPHAVNPCLVKVSAIRGHNGRVSLGEGLLEERRRRRRAGDPRLSAEGRELFQRMPTDGPVPFVPPKNRDVNKPRLGEVNGRRGYVDAFGNVWSKGRGVGDDAFEWDVQVKSGQRLSKDGKHVNVSTGGKITH